MIYKFIDNNGSEITVNSISSLQALVDSETVKKDTKVKAGLRGNWTTASKIEELNFNQEEVEESEETQGPEGDIKSFITAEEKPEEIIVEEKSEEASTQPEQAKKEEAPVEKIEEKTEYEPEEEKRDKTEDDKLEEVYADEKMEDINFFQSIKICFQKFFIFKGRASRSEYWWFYLFYIVTGVIPSFIPNELAMALGWIMMILLFIPSLAVAVRRLHDVNTSGYFMFMGIIPVLGAIIVFVKIIEKGTLEKNRFGEYPLKFKKGK